MHLPSLNGILPGGPVVQLNMALSFLLRGSVLWLLQDKEISPRKKQVGKILAAIGLLMTLWTFQACLL